MSQFRLDGSKAVELQLSNDAFFYLLEEEEPLDESNLEEAQEILAMFPNGFVINDNWKYVEDSDLVEALFIPYTIDDADYDEYLELTKNIQLQIKWLNSTQIKAWWFNSEAGTRELKGEFIVRTNEYGLKYFHTGEKQDEAFVAGKMSMYFLKHFKKKAA